MTSSTTGLTDIATEALFRELASCAEPGELEGLLDIERRLRELSFDIDPSVEEEVRTSDLGRFEQRELIGRGGQSLVFRAVDPRLDREVAIKVHSGFGAEGMLGLRRLVHEARALAHLDLPGVVRIHDAYEEDGRAFVVMESVDGPPLSELIDVLAGRAGQSADFTVALAAELQPIEARCRLVRDLARSLFAVHERGVIHRDVKPANVLVERGLRPKWIDFGLSHKDGTETELTSAFLIGTPAYISPEQVKNRRTGASALSDQYSLGVLFYELLTLENPFRRETREETLDAIAAGDPPRPRSKNPRIPIEVERIALHMLEPVPQARYEDANALARDLDAYLEHRPISIGAPTLFERARKFSRRNAREARLSAIAIGSMLLIGVVLLTLGSIRARAVQRQRMERILDELPRTGTRDEAYLAIQALEDLHDEILRDRSDRLASWIPGGIPLQQELNRASEELAALIGREEAERAAKGEDFFPSDWQAVLELERALNPLCNATAHYRDLGTLAFRAPRERIRMWRLAGRRELRFPALEECPLARRLREGIYRAELRTDGRLEREHLFLTDPDGPPIQVLAKRPSVRVLERFIELSFDSVDFASWAVERGWEEQSHSEWSQFFFSTDFRIAPRAVTWREIRDVFGTPLPRRIAQDLQNSVSAANGIIPEDVLDQAAKVSPVVAFEHAAALGMRLPTGLELVFALEQDQGFVFADRELTCWPGFAGATTQCLQPKEVAHHSPVSPNSMFSFPNDSNMVGASFRLASSVHL